MKAYLCDHDGIQGWILNMATEKKVYFPQKHGSKSFRFEEVVPHSDVQFEEYQPTIVPPVKKMMPARDELIQFRKKDGGDFEASAILDTSERVLAGVRPCDLKGIHIMDAVFGQGISDPHYRARRDHTHIIAYVCSSSCGDGCFCEASGSLDHREGADVILTPLGDGRILVEALTDHGESLLEGAGFAPCHEAESISHKARRARPEPFGRQFSGPIDDLSDQLNQAWDGPIWEKHVEMCFSCGTCNLVCPTCYCFDVQDEMAIDGVSGSRTRSWDGCMLPGFASVAGGHNFRSTPAARQRHRVKKKFEYLPERFDFGAACVGCGRCGAQCTAGIDIFDIVNDVMQEGVLA